MKSEVHRCKKQIEKREKYVEKLCYFKIPVFLNVQYTEYVYNADND